MAEITEQVLVDRDELLQCMGITAMTMAYQTLSPEGKDVLRMLLAAEEAGIGKVEAYIEATAFEALAHEDQAIIEAYLANRVLIDQFEDYEG